MKHLIAILKKDGMVATGQFSYISMSQHKKFMKRVQEGLLRNKNIILSTGKEQLLVCYFRE